MFFFQHNCPYSSLPNSTSNYIFPELKQVRLTSCSLFACDKVKSLFAPQKRTTTVSTQDFVIITADKAAGHKALQERMQTRNSSSHGSAESHLNLSSLWTNKERLRGQSGKTWLYYWQWWETVQQIRFLFTLNPIEVFKLSFECLSVSCHRPSNIQINNFKTKSSIRMKWFIGLNGEQSTKQMLLHNMIFRYFSTLW